ncbi:hypothetical protein ABPG74_017052 [Tetrahymena malaccensis]
MKITGLLLISLAVLSVITAKQDSEIINILKECESKMESLKSACSNDNDCQKDQLAFRSCSKEKCTPESLNSISGQISCTKACYPSNSILKQQADFMIDCLSSPIMILASSLISLIFLL